MDAANWPNFHRAKMSAAMTLVSMMMLGICQRALTDDAVTGLRDDTVTRLRDDTMTRLRDDTVTRLTVDTVIRLTDDTVTRLRDDTVTRLTDDTVTRLRDDTVTRLLLSADSGSDECSLRTNSNYSGRCHCSSLLDIHCSGLDQIPHFVSNERIYTAINMAEQVLTEVPQSAVDGLKVRLELVNDSSYVSAYSAVMLGLARRRMGNEIRGYNLTLSTQSYR